MPSKLQAKSSLKVFDYQATLKKEKKLQFAELTTFNSGSVGIFVASKGTSPWEYHPDSDEFLQVLEGSVDIEILTEKGSEVISLDEGQCCVVPKGHWHRHIVSGHLRELFVTPGETDHCALDDPRKERAAKKKPAPGQTASKQPASKQTERALIDHIRKFAMSFPEVHEDMPWGHPAFKVKGKSFVVVGFQEHGIRLTVKLTSSRLRALGLDFVVPTGHGWGATGWITADLKSDETRISRDEIDAWIMESFRAVAPKALLKEFDGVPAGKRKAGKRL